MKVSVIVIGDELLIGQVTDTNSGTLARDMAPFGWEVDNVQTVGDSAGAISRAISHAFGLTDIVLTTGGLGPTKDDITKRVLCDYFGGELIHDPDVTANIITLFDKRGLKLNELTAAQAMVPSSCRVIQNLAGTAPIMWFEKDGKVLVSMPGVPFETATMFPKAVLPALLERFGSDIHIEHSVTLVTGYTESALAMKIASWEESLPSCLHLAYLPKPGLVRLSIDGLHSDPAYIREAVADAARSLRAILGDAVFATADLTPAEVLINECRSRGVMIATAESCTGGNVAHELTLIPGASDVVAGGIVSYSNEVKTAVLGVSPDTLAAHGAVSHPVVREMAAGASRATGARLTVATSGIAGPGGGSEEKPVGTVCFCARYQSGDGHVGEETVTYRFNGNRARIIESATTRALILAATLLRRES